MKNELIAEIKAQLAFINDADHADIQRWRADSRQGVQKLLAQFDNRLAKDAAIVAHYHEMSQFEEQARQAGYTLLAGVDEVGRGPLAGPVVAAAVILDASKPIYGLDDSKKLSEKKRQALYAQIKDEAIAIGIGMLSPEEIDEVNIYEASKRAMMQAIQQLKPAPDYLLIDAMELALPIEQIKLIKGDARSVSIAAASIVAKVYRDDLMQKYDETYPGYGFAKNAGYGTAEHLAGLAQQGITPIHRKTFAPVKQYVK